MNHGLLQHGALAVPVQPGLWHGAVVVRSRPQGAEIPTPAQVDGLGSVVDEVEVRRVLGRRLVDAPWLVRLGRVSFLGTLDHHPASRAVTSRRAHALGVASLGLRAGRALGLSESALRVLVAACLVHDVGHFPLSHAAESGFVAATGVDHHCVTEWLVRGNGMIATDASLRPALERADIDPERVWEVLAGTPSSGDAELAALLHAPINLDTLDGIRRTAACFGRRSLRLPEELFGWADGALAVVPEAVPVLDRFWALKDRIYRTVINLPTNIACEVALARQVAEAFDHRIFPEFLAFDDDALAGRMAAVAASVGLRAGADAQFVASRRPLSEASLARVHKRYFVDRSVAPEPAGLPVSLWAQRYRHVRQPRYVTPQPAVEQLDLPGFVLHASPPRSLPGGAEGPEI